MSHLYPMNVTCYLFNVAHAEGICDVPLAGTSSVIIFCKYDHRGEKVYILVKFSFPCIYIRTFPPLLYKYCPMLR